MPCRGGKSITKGETLLITNKMSRGTGSSPRSSIKLEYPQNSILTAPCGGFLYDTVNLSGFTKDCEKTLSPLSSIRNGNGRFNRDGPVMMGKLDNLTIEVFKTGKVHLRGSLVTFALGHNISPLTREQYEDVIELLSDELSIDLEAFTVNRCDLALTVETKGKPFEYLRMLSDMRLKGGIALLPNMHVTTRRYKISDKKEFEFYDKSAKLKISRRNMLRIEYRVGKHIERLRKGRIKKSGSVTLKEILEPSFVKGFISEFEQHFLSVGMSGRESIYDPKEIRKAVVQAIKEAKNGF